MSAYVTVGAGGDYATIQDAINDGANAIFLKAQIHTFSQSVTLLQGCHILGESPYHTIVDFDSEAYAFLINDDDIILEGFRVVNCGNTNGAFIFSGVANCTVRNCRIEGGDRAATLIGSTYCTFSDNLCLNQSLDAIWVDELSTDNRIRSNKVTDSLLYGIRILGAFNKITENTVSGCTNDGILLVAANNVVMGNTCNNCANGIFTAQERGDDNLIQGNICRDNRGYGINVNALDNSGNVVIGNVCKDNFVADIRFVPGNYCGFNDARTVV